MVRITTQSQTQSKHSQAAFMSQESDSSNPIWTDENIDELLYGMIKSAINDVRDGRKSKLMRQEAAKWLLDDDYIHPLSFCNCCRSLGLDAELLRSMLSRLLQGRFSHESI
ncbi:hypothetical protein VA249_45200 (plasmid) [Vibrio alfacsensis]|uniref:hypothetical protein n=1 Tax=Vibrio alfacsensis TaxID=1074311 RepID=UPI001BF01EEA|nr:hypothetical protein [Vibrio alfacsensis]BBM67874.1 hypothetical protein VA249_45200 [Vibrio alfacsensis]